MTITLGWWFFPTIITILSYLWMDHKSKQIGSGIAGAIGEIIYASTWFACIAVMWIVYLLCVIFLKIT